MTLLFCFVWTRNDPGKTVTVFRERAAAAVIRLWMRLQRRKYGSALRQHLYRTRLLHFFGVILIYLWNCRSGCLLLPEHSLDRRPTSIPRDAQEYCTPRRPPHDGSFLEASSLLIYPKR